MKATQAVEDYLKAIYALTTSGEGATTSHIAQRLGVASPTVSGMVKRLEADQLVARAGAGAISLTPAGEREALRVVRRHRLLETFLAEVVGVPWDEVHDEAEILEHALSDRLEERIDALLDHPSYDPHGDPIPSRDGHHTEDWADPLDATPPGARFRVERVSDRDSAALRYLASLGIRPGVVLEVGEREPFGGPQWVTVADERLALGQQLARLLHGATLDNRSCG